MKKRLIFAALLLGSTSLAARADEIADLKAQSAKLAKQNEALAAKLSAVEKRQKQVEKQVAAKPQMAAQAQGPNGSILDGAQWTAADLTRRILSPTDDSTFTFHGITIYGGIDAGVSYQNHGTALSQYYSPGLEYVITKNSLRQIFTMAPNALSQSNFGIKGVEELIPGISAVFNAQVNFNPQSGLTSDNLRALSQQNGLAATSPQVSGGDSSRAVPFSQLYGGFSSPTWGTITFGRQNSLELDGIIAYDPMGGSNAFSVIGYQGGWAGGGVTETARWDESLKYRVNVGNFRAALMYKFAGANAEASEAYSGQVGFDWNGFSADGIVAKTNDAISASQLSTAQQTFLTATPGALSVLSGAPGILAATASDNLSFMGLVKYKWNNQWKFYAGYENTTFYNPSSPVSGNAYTIGGYALAFVNNNAYNIHKNQQMMWVGGTYSVRPDLDLTLAYYHEIQSTFGGTNVTNAPAGFPAVAPNLATVGCTSVAASNCRGTLDAISGLVDYRITKRLDVYAGMMWSSVRNGLANGFAAAGTSNAAGMIDPTVGLRFQF